MIPRVPILLLVAALASSSLFAQTLADVEGQWAGTLVAGGNQWRLVLDVTRASDGLLLGRVTSVDQGGARITIDKIEHTGTSVHLEMKSVHAVFDGVISDDNTKLKGTWNQGSPLPVEFTRTAPVTAASPPPAAPAATAAPAKNPFGLPLEIVVPVPPTPFSSGGRRHLVYELHVTNFAPAEELIAKVEVFSGHTTLAAYEGTQLNNMLVLTGVPNAVDKRAVGPGQRAIVFLWVTLDADMPLPTSLHHRVTVRNQTAEGPPVAVRTGRPLALGPPLRGANWIAANGPSNASTNRRALFPFNGGVYIAQRFAIDWAQIGPNGYTFDGDKKDNKAYRAYGSEILAVADASVVSTTDGIPDNVPGALAVSITPETIGGNDLILDLGGGRFAIYAHIQPGSLRVKVGETVRRGQTLGLVGNSGNSKEPHLHFQVCDRPLALESEGLPYAFESFEVQTTPSKWESRQNELPLENARVRFPAVK